MIHDEYSTKKDINNNRWSHKKQVPTPMADVVLLTPFCSLSEGFQHIYLHSSTLYLSLFTWAKNNLKPILLFSRVSGISLLKSAEWVLRIMQNPARPTLTGFVFSFWAESLGCTCFHFSKRNRYAYATPGIDQIAKSNLKDVIR